MQNGWKETSILLYTHCKPVNGIFSSYKCGSDHEQSNHRPLVQLLHRVLGIRTYLFDRTCQSPKICESNQMSKRQLAPSDSRILSSALSVFLFLCQKRVINQFARACGSVRHLPSQCTLSRTYSCHTRVTWALSVRLGNV